MNAKTRVGLVAGLVVVTAIVVFAAVGSTNREQVADLPGEQQNAHGGSQTPETLEDLLAQYTNQECTIRHEYLPGGGMLGDVAEPVGYVTTGTVYVGRNQMRGDFQHDDGEITHTHMIVDGDDVYVWMDDEVQGIQMTVDDTSDEMAESGGVDFEDEVELNCKRWNPQASKFQLPDGVEFLTVEAMMEEVFGDVMPEIELPADMMAEQCALCDDTGSARDACREALGCP